MREEGWVRLVFGVLVGGRRKRRKEIRRRRKRKREIMRK